MQPQPYDPVNGSDQFPSQRYPQQGYVNNPGITTTTYPMQDPYQQQSYSSFAIQQPSSGFPNQQPQGFTQYNNQTYINQPQVIGNNDDFPSYTPQQPSQTSYVKPDKPKQPQKVSRINRTLTFLGDVQNPGRGYNLLALISMVVILGLVIALTAYHFGNKDIKLTSVSGGLEHIVKNLNADPILELSTAGSRLYCPAGTEALYLGKWGGTTQGCNCVVTGLTASSCSRDEWTCSDIQNINAIDMYIWEGSVICAKKAQLNVDYVKSAVCPTGFRKCYTGICVENSKNCPVNSITITTGGSDPSLRFSTTSKYLVYTNVQNNAPVVEVEMSMNNIPCFSTTEIPSGAGSYTLLNDEPKGCQKYGVDTTYSYEMDRLRNDLVFQANGFPASVFNLPGYQTILQNTDIILSGRKRIDVAEIDECLSLDTDIIMNASIASENMNKYMTGSTIAAMAMHGCLFILTLINVLAMKGSRTWKEILGEDAKQYMSFYLYLGFAEVIIFIVMVGLCESAHADMSKAKNYLSELDEMGCFPSGAPKQVVADYDDLVNSVARNLSGLSITLLVTSLLSYGPIIMKVFSKWREGKRKNKKTFSY